VFEPFFTTKTAGDGTGLGLSIVYGIVSQHGGEISLERSPAGGAKFVVELPIVAGGSEMKVKPGAPAVISRPGVATPNARTGPQRILVVEDEPTVAQLIADVLREEGHQVDCVLDSREGLAQLRRNTYSLVICDLRMPHVDGREFYRQLAASGNPLQHRFVFVTGDTLAPHTLEFLESSGMPYLAKPFLVEELKRALQRALGSPADTSSAVAGQSSAGPKQPAARKS
jgi:CheY-like chemotaxis protein